MILRVRAARQPAHDLLLHFHGEETDPRVYWAQQISKQVAAWNGVIDKYLRPVEILMAPPAQLMSLGEAAHESRREALAATFSLRDIAVEGIPGLVPLLAFHGRREQREIPPAVSEWLDLLVTEVEHSRRSASEQLARLDELIAQSQQLEGGMGLRFLYDEERRIFAIGYQVAERRLDNFVLRFARERSAPNEFPGHRARGRAGGTLVGFEPPLWLCLRAAAASLLERDDVRIFDAALVHPDAREFTARSRLSRCRALSDCLCRAKQRAVGHLGIRFQRARPA